MDRERYLRQTYERIASLLSEQSRRLWAASEAISFGYGGVSVVSRATGLSRQTIHTGIDELKTDTVLKDQDRVRRGGGGRSKIEKLDTTVVSALQELIKNHTRGDPMQALFWTCKSTENLAQELRKKGHQISDRTVARLLQDLDYSLQSNRKSREGKQSPERSSQFDYINKMVEEFQNRKQPVISVDTKKKELVGNYKNSGQEWHPKGQPAQVEVHDFGNKKAIPYGIYDVTWNTGWVSVGVDHDTSEFAVESIRNWWRNMGKVSYPDAKELLINADGGGSNSSRVKLWKYQLQLLSDETGLEITVCHLPPGTSKWNKIEHRLFCHITRNWRARPLTSYEVIVNLIGSTITKTGLKVRAKLDEKKYPLAVKVPPNEMRRIKIRRHDINSRWNYTISPRY